MPVKSAALLRLRLRTELRKARVAAGLTQREVADRMEWSPSKLIRIEAGRSVSPSTICARSPPPTGSRTDASWTSCWTWHAAAGACRSPNTATCTAKTSCSASRWSRRHRSIASSGRCCCRVCCRPRTTCGLSSVRTARTCRKRTWTASSSHASRGRSS
ncbi:helix-turn-helix transcriptional regulator [Streptomyces albogriseolus]